MDQSSEHSQHSETGRTGKRKYEPPQILSQEIFETTALACGKLVGQGGPKCGPNPRLS